MVLYKNLQLTEKENGDPQNEEETIEAKREERKKELRFLRNFDVDIINAFNGDYLITQIFEHEVYSFLRKFCEIEDLVHLKELTDKQLLRLKKSSDISVKLYSQMNRRLEKFKKLEIILTNHDEMFKTLQSAKAIPISELFDAQTYRSFLDFCENKGLKVVSDISKYYLCDSFRNTPGVGHIKYNEILNILLEYSDIVRENEKSVFSVGKFYDFIASMKVSDVAQNMDLIMEETEVTIADIVGKDLNELKHLADPLIFTTMMIKLSVLNLPKEIFLKFKDQLNTALGRMFKMRFQQLKSLDEVVFDLSASKGLVENTDKNLRYKFRKFYKDHKIFESLRIILNEKDYFGETELSEAIGVENQDIFELLKSTREPLFYHSVFKIFFFSKDEEIEFETRIQKYFNELPEIFNINNYEQFFEELLPTVGNNKFELVYDKYGFHKYGDYYSQRKLNITDILSLVYKNQIGNPMRLDKDGVQIIVDLAKKYYDYELTNSVRVIGGRVRDAKQLILVDKLTYKWFSPDEISKSLILEISDYLSVEFETREFISAEQVYQNFEAELNKQFIYNKLHMYSVIKYFLNDKFTTGTGNALNIYPNESKRMTAEEKLISLIANAGGVSNKVELQKITKWAMYRINNIISASNQIVLHKEDEVRLLSSMNLTEEIKYNIRFVVNKCMQRGFTTIMVIRKEISQHKFVDDYIRHHELDNPKSLAAFIKTIVPDVKGQGLFLYHNNNPEKSIEEAIAKFVDKPLTRDELVDRIKEFGYKEPTAKNLFKKLLDKKLFIEIDQSLYIPNGRQI